MGKKRQLLRKLRKSIISIKEMFRGEGAPYLQLIPEWLKKKYAER